MSTDVARRYADALVDLAAERDLLEHVSRELSAFGDTLAGSATLTSALRNPVFSLEERQAVVGALLERAGVAGITRNFLYLLVENGRVDALSDIISAFEDRVDARLGRVRASSSPCLAVSCISVSLNYFSCWS